MSPDTATTVLGLWFLYEGELFRMFKYNCTVRDARCNGDVLHRVKSDTVFSQLAQDHNQLEYQTPHCLFVLRSGIERTRTQRHTWTRNSCKGGGGNLCPLK